MTHARPIRELHASRQTLRKYWLCEAIATHQHWPQAQVAAQRAARDPVAKHRYLHSSAQLEAANLVTAAEALRYGTCLSGVVLNHFDVLAHDLKLPPGVWPVVGLTVGVREEDATS